MGRHKKEHIGLASEVVEGTVTTRTDAPGKLPEPKKVWYEVKHYINNGVDSLKVALKKEIPNYGIMSQLAARLIKRNGRWENSNGQNVSGEIRTAIKNAGY